MKIKKSKKKELVDIDIQLNYYHKEGAIEPRYIKETITRRKAEKRGYESCVLCFR